MKAIVYTKYGSPDVLALKEVEKPIPKDDQVLINVHAASANAADWHLLRGDPFLLRLTGTGLLRPKNTILGSDVAGRVEAVGKDIKQFQPGDEVFGDLSGCGLGGFAEYVSVPENVLVLKPENLSFEEAAAVPMAAVTALQGIRDEGQIRPGQRVLINGASGGVGTFAVQIAKSFGAEVTSVRIPAIPAKISADVSAAQVVICDYFPPLLRLFLARVLLQDTGELQEPRLTCSVYQ